MVKPQSQSARILDTSHVQIPAEGVTLKGDLTLPDAARGVIAFVHGSGSSRHSARDAYVANVLQLAGFATLLIDLVTEEEAAARPKTTRRRRDIEMQAFRLTATSEWLSRNSATAKRPIGYLGEGTGMAVALSAAARFAGTIFAIVSRSGRPELAGMALHKVLGPTLLIVAENDPQVLALNRHAYYAIPSEKKLEIVRNATHLFEEPGALDKVAHLARHWFETHLPSENRSAA
jgi:dienelactone hydrolase